MVYFGVDYGETVGFSIIDNNGSVIMLGSSKDSQLCLEQLELTLKYYPIINVVIEKQIGVKTERFTKFIETVTLLCSLAKSELIEVYPHVWKNSFINRTKIKVTNHAQDSAKIALYGMYKKSTQ